MKIPNKIKLYQPYDNRECLHCHAGARNFEEGATHNMEEGRLGLIKSRQLSCMTTGCHDVGHNVKALGAKPFRNGIPATTTVTSPESAQAAKEEK